MGAGYSIRSVHNGNYVTIESGLADGTVVANPYPVSWVFDASDPEENDWVAEQRIMLEYGSRHILLQSDDSSSGSPGVFGAS